jgi:hypothetical protein
MNQEETMIKTVTAQEKVAVVLDYNTLFYYDQQSEEEYDYYIQSLVYKCLELQQEIKFGAPVRDLFENIIAEKSGLVILLAITAISFEDLSKYIPIICDTTDAETIELSHRDMWYTESTKNSWSAPKINKLLSKNAHFRKCIINLIYDAPKVPFLAKVIPLFKLKNFQSKKLEDFVLFPESVLDTLCRYKERGSYAAKKENNAEQEIEKLLSEIGLTYETGSLTNIHKNEISTNRTMDFMIPNKNNPFAIIESSVTTTTASGQGDKAKAEIGMRTNIMQYYPNAAFFGIVDGIGWKRRTSDLDRMVESFDDVFTLHPQQMNRLKTILTERKINYENAHA